MTLKKISQIFSNGYFISVASRKFYQFWIESHSSLVSVSHLIRWSFAFYRGKINEKRWLYLATRKPATCSRKNEKQFQSLSSAIEKTCH